MGLGHIFHALWDCGSIPQLSFKYSDIVIRWQYPRTHQNPPGFRAEHFVAPKNPSDYS